MAIKVVVPVVVEMTDEQVAVYAEEYGLPRNGGKLYAREIVRDVRETVLVAVQGSPAFHESGAQVSIKER